MSMSIKIQDGDKREYTLTFTKKTIESMANNGFTLDACRDNPVLGVPQLFAGAFLKNHRTISQAQIDEVWASIENKEGLITALIEMYSEQVNNLFGEPDEAAKKSTWQVVK